MSLRVILAFSGGLETTLCVHWLKFHRDCQVITFSADLGYGGNFAELGELAIECGAQAAHISDLRERFLTEFCFPALRAGARYENHYLLSAALSRPLIVSELTRLAMEDGCRAVAHGCTPKGNDQLRFEASIARLAPNLEILAPLRLWHYRTREELIREAEQLGFRLLAAPDERFSHDRNIWGAVIEARQITDTEQELPDTIYTMTRSIDQTPDQPETVRIGFERARPVALDGEALGPVALLERLNDLGGRHGVGRSDVIEDRLGGTKTRKAYEQPGATLLYQALQGLEELTLSREVRAFRVLPSQRYAELVHSGRWYTDLRESLDAFFGRSAYYVSGSVTLRCFKGSARVIARESPYSQYNPARFRDGVDPMFSLDDDTANLLMSYHQEAERDAHRERTEQQRRDENPLDDG